MLQAFTSTVIIEFDCTRQSGRNFIKIKWSCVSNNLLYTENMKHKLFYRIDNNSKEHLMLDWCGYQIHYDISL